MSFFEAMKVGQRKAQEAGKKAKKFVCGVCNKRFVNAGAFATHSKSHPKFKEKPKPQRSNVLNLLDERKRESSQKRPRELTHELPKKSHRDQNKTHVKSRNRFSNLKKYRLVLHYELLRESNPKTYVDDWEVSTMLDGKLQCVICLVQSKIRSPLQCSQKYLLLFPG